jgi:hypothetical protein
MKSNVFYLIPPSYLLNKHKWNLAAMAATLNNTLDDLVKRLEKVRFGYLIDQQVREQVTKRMK